jgi:hypothetical protein
VVFDPNWASVNLLLHSEAANNSTTFVDTTGTNASFTIVGTAKHSTTTAKFGSSSMAFLAGGGHIYTNTDLTVDGGATPMTVEAWVYAASSGGGGIVSVNHTSSVGVTFGLGGPGSSGLTPYFGFYVSGWDVVTSPTAISTGVWTHVAGTYDGTNMRIFVDGVLKATLARTMPSYTGRFYVGANWTGNNPLDGYLEEVRLTPGVCRYVNTFSPPTLPFDWGVTTTVSGTVLDRTGAPVQRKVYAFDRTDGTLLNTTLSNASTGAYSMLVGAECFVVCVADDTAPLQNSMLLDRIVPV